MIETPMKRQTALVLGCYLTVYVVWGSTYFFIKQAVETFPPFALMAVRWTIGGLVLLGVSAARGRLLPLPTPREVLSAIVLGSFLLLGGNGFITVAERRIDSYIAALLVSSTPILVALFDRVVVGRRLTAMRLLAIVAGFAGVALLLYNGRSLVSSLSPAVLLGLAGVLSWSIATSLGHRFPVAPDNMVNSGMQMLFTGIVSLAVTLLFETPPSQVIPHLSARSLFGAAYLTALGTFAFAAFTYLISHEPAERVVSYALVNPLIALFLGLAVGSETATPFLGLGTPLIILGLVLMLYGERLVSRVREASARQR
jgi:drug/metabolite transporter (DMT)-like permease